MKVIKYDGNDLKLLPSSHDLVLSGDEHGGSFLRYDDGIHMKNDFLLAEKNRFGVDMGDRLEAISMDDKRYDRTAKESIPLQQALEAIREDREIASKQLVRLMGNHERKLWKFGNMTKFMCDELKVPYGGYVCVLEVHDKFGPMYKIYLHHGFGTLTSNAKDYEQMLGNWKASLKKKLRYKAGDCLLMAMGHCFSEDTEILTKEGWKNYSQLQENEEVLTFNTTTALAEWQAIEAKYVYENKYSEMLACQTDMVDFMVTEDHRIIYQNRHAGTWNEGRAQDVMDRSETTLPVSASSGNEDYGIDDNMLRLIGWLVSEGHFRIDSDAIQLYQHWEGMGEIERVLTSLSIPFTIYRKKTKGREFADGDKVYQTNDDSAVFHIKSRDAGAVRCYIDEKQLPDYVFKLSDRQFDILLDALVLGDGHWTNRGQSGQYYSGSPELIDKLQAACMCHGWRTSKKVRYRRDRPNICLNIVKTETSSLINRNKNRKGEIWHLVDATPIVWCVSVPNGTVAVRRNGKPVFLGNTHKLFYVEPTRQLFLTFGSGHAKQHYLTWDGNFEWIEPDNRWYLSTGSFYKLHWEGDEPGYGEVRGFDPVELGYLVLKVRDRKVVGVEKVVV